jgi:hypothetical protein
MSVRAVTPQRELARQGTQIVDAIERPLRLQDAACVLEQVGSATEVTVAINLVACMVSATYDYCRL